MPINIGIYVDVTFFFCCFVLTLVAFCSMTISCWSIAFYVTITRQKYLFVIFLWFMLCFAFLSVLLVFICYGYASLPFFISCSFISSRKLMNLLSLLYITSYLYIAMQLDLNGEANFIFEKFNFLSCLFFEKLKRMQKCFLFKKYFFCSF